MADRIVMPLGPGLGFTELESIALSASKESSLAGNKAPQLSGPRHGSPFHSMTNPHLNSTRGLWMLLLSKMHILDSDPSLKLQHTLTQQLSEQRLKALYDKLDPPSRRIVDSAMEKHAG